MSDEPAKRYETIDHTADIAIKAFGQTLAEAYANAAFAMFDIISDLPKVRAIEVRRIEVEAPDMEQLLVDWLSELLYLFEVDEVLFSEFKVELDGTRLSAVVRGEAIDNARHSLSTEIKAVTYHMLAIDEAEKTVQVLFDI